MLIDEKKHGKDPHYKKILKIEAINNRLEDLWVDFCPFADSNFKQDFPENLISRFWEMYLGSMFIQEGKKLQKVSNGGPDICIVEPAGNILWVEAIASTPGVGPDKVPNLRKIDWIKKEKVILRIRSAIEAKYIKYLSYLEKGYILDSDPYVIAINSFKIEHAQSDVYPSFIIQSISPIGPETICINPETGEKTREGYKHRTEIIKINRAPVKTDIIMQDKYRVISAFIYSEVSPYEIPSKLGSKIRIVHNPKAINRIIDGWLPIGIEYKFDENNITRINWNRKTTESG